MEDRNKNDLYKTPHGVIKAWTRRLDKALHPYKGNGRVYDLGAYDGRVGLSVSKALDMDLTQIELVRGWDYLKSRPKFLGIDRVNVAVANPPFIVAGQFMQQAIDDGFDFISMLLRVTILGSRRRVDFWNKYPMDCFYAIAPRPSFTKGGKTDSSEYAVFNWYRRLTVSEPFYSVEVWK